MTRLKPYEIHTINGLKVAFYPIKGFPAIKANLYVHGGSSYEKGPKWGAFHFVEHLCFEGTKIFPNRSEVELYKEEYGLNSNATTGLSYIKFWTYGPSQSLQQALTLINELAFNARLPESSYQKQVSIITQELKGHWDNLNFRFGYENLKQLFGEKHIYTQDPGGQAEYLSTLTRDDLLKIHNKFFKNENSILTITGDFEIESAKEFIKKIFLATDGKHHPFPKFPIKPGKKTNLHIEDVQQNRINLMWTGKGSNDNSFVDNLALQIGAYILGGSSRSFLNKQLRESLHLVYTNGFSRSLFPHAGSLIAWAATTPDNTQTAVEEMRKIVYDFLKQPIEEKLFQRSVNFIKSSTSLSYDSIHSISDSITNYLFREDKIRLPEEIIEDLDSITEAKVREVLGHYIKPENEYLAIMTKDKNLKI